MYEVSFAIDGIDSVYHEIAAAEKRVEAVGVLWGVAYGDRIYCRIGGYFEKHIPQDIHFRFSDRRRQGLTLAVDIRFCNQIVVHYREMSCACAQQGFRAPSADASHAEYRNVRG